MDTEEHSGRLWTKISNFFTSKEENIEQAILEAQEDGDIKAEEGSMLLSILELDTMQINEIMTPRTDIACLPVDVSIKEVAEAILETGHSRIPIYEETKDNIIGIAYAKDLLFLLLDSQRHLEPIAMYIRKAYFVPETKICSQLLQEFRTRKNHIAIVVDEYGGTSGLVTIEDLLEVIVGEIEDEHDTPRDEEIKPINDTQFHMLGRVFLEDLEEIGLNIESEEVDTIGGYLCLLAGKVPAENDEFRLADWKLTIAEADAKQVKSVIAEKITDEIEQKNINIE